MTFKIYRQMGGPKAPVRELIHNTFLLYFSKKKGEHRWFSVAGVAMYGVPSGFVEVSFESWEQVNELIRFHPEVKFYNGRMCFIGYKENLVIGKTTKWTSV